jgi:uncharacterized protein (TIGR03435 family)
MGGPFVNWISVFTALLMAVFGSKVSAQQSQGTAGQASPLDKGMVFEVASVKVNKSGGLGMPSGTKGRIYRATNIPLRYLIAAAYQVPAARVLGGPAWLGAASVDMRFVGGDRFDISANLPEGSSVGEVPAMLRALLADRFKLTVHTTTRDAPIYALVVARTDGRLGQQLRKAPVDCEATGTVLTSADAARVASPELNPDEQARCQLEVGGRILGRGQRLSALARILSLFADRPVIDQTGLAGGFDFDLQFPELATAPNAVAPSTEPATGVLTALREQLGLKLQTARGNLNFIVIDNVAHPTEN